MEHAKRSSERPDDRERPLICPACVRPNEPGVHFCVHCNAPITSHAAIDPLGSVWARGYAWHQAAAGRPKGIVVAAMWLIFGPGAVLFMWLAVGMVADYLSIDLPGRVVVLFGPDLPTVLFRVALLGFSATVIIVLLVRVTKNHLRTRQLARSENDT